MKFWCLAARNASCLTLFRAYRKSDSFPMQCVQQTHKGFNLKDSFFGKFSKMKNSFVREFCTHFLSKNTLSSPWLCWSLCQFKFFLHTVWSKKAFSMLLLCKTRTSRLHNRKFKSCCSMEENRTEKNQLLSFIHSDKLQSSAFESSENFQWETTQPPQSSILHSTRVAFRTLSLIHSTHFSWLF